MRSLVIGLAVLGLAGPALAQGQGSFALDAMTTPGRHFGLGYYLTDGLSLRPRLGATYSRQFGVTFDLGTDFRWEMLPGSRFSPYATAGIDYERNPTLVQLAPGGSAYSATDPTFLRYGGGLGVRARVAHGFSLVAEGRVMNSALRSVTGGPFYSEWAVDPGAHFEAALGLSYLLH